MHHSPPSKPTQRQLLPPLLIALAVSASAPAMGEIRDLLLRSMPGLFLKVLVLTLLGVGAGLLLWAMLHIREHRWPRYSALLATVALVWLQARGFATGNLRVDVVEKVHILEYGTIAFLLYLAFRQRGDLSTLLLPLIGTLLAAVAEESVQWWAPQRVGEIRDVGVDLAAGIAGLVFGLGVKPPARWCWSLLPGSRRWLLRGTAVALLAVSGFFALAHLGQEIEDPEIGRFRSRFSRQQLLELQQTRARQWAAQPPDGLEVLGPEDYYLTEAGAHALHRNERLESGDPFMAWQANRILEKYFSPFLDLHSFRHAGRHRYSAEQRRALEVQVPPPDPARYRSPVEAERLYLWPSRWALLGVGFAFFALLWLAAGQRSTE